MPETAFIIRVPSVVGPSLVTRLKKTARPYALEVVGDPFEVFSGAVVNPIVDRLLRFYFTNALRKSIAGARGVAYVTSRTLQSRYPAPFGAMTTHYSSVELPDAAFVNEINQTRAHGRIVVAVGTHSQLYKGHGVLICAASLLRSRGRPIRVRIAGSGRFHDHLKEQAANLGVADDIEFLGQLPAGNQIRDLIDSGDIFVMPSLTEGLPRALIEAMARGKACIGSRVGAIPELLGEAEMVEPGNAGEFACRIDELLEDRDRLISLGRTNLTKSTDYSNDILNKKRTEFYQYLKSIN